LIDYIARSDSLPRSLKPLAEEGALSGREITNSGSAAPIYRKTGEKTFILK
jgi:hypothetical protein